MVKEETTLLISLLKNKHHKIFNLILKKPHMQATPLKNSIINTHLKVIKNDVTKSLDNSVKGIYINTLMPDFSYENNKGTLISPNNCIFL